MITLFDKNKKWYKANFHAHSTNSDGLLTPHEMVKVYKENGYAILMLSEHERYTDTTEFDRDDFIVYPGIERSIMLPDQETFHIQGIADFTQENNQRYTNQEYIPVPDYHDMQDVQKILDELKNHGNFVMINHPYWSFNSFDRLHFSNNYDFLEIYNHNCHALTDHGNNEIYYDELLKTNHFNVLATDDNHNSHRYKPGIHMVDRFGGFTMLQLDELSRKGISEALKNGHFYASSGPEIYQITQEGNTISVQCSPVETIAFKAWPRRGYCAQQEIDQPLTSASYTLRGNEQWIRITCIDHQGKRAWSNPIYLEK